jgi:thiomorpholine-carboxylate dehydrogenase
MEREREEERKRQKREDNDVLFIKETAVEKLLNWNDCVDAMESALVCMLKTNTSRDEPFSTQTQRTFTPVSGKGVLLTMPGFASNYTLKAVTGHDCRHSTLACKLVTSFGGNSQLNPPVPTILATILLLDATTGKLKAIIDGTDITAWRTAAVSVVATKYLYYSTARPTMSSDSDGRRMTLSILGCGTQVH